MVIPMKKVLKNIKGYMKTSKLGTVAAIVILLVVVIAIIAPGIAPYDPDETNLLLSLKPSSPEHLFGTDMNGRDIFSRIIYGSRTVFLGTIVVVAISTVIGVFLGTISGYFGGLVDSIISRILDVASAFPSLLLAFVIVAAFGNGIRNTAIALSVVYIPLMARVVRSVTLVEKNKCYVEAARSMHFSDARILFGHILPNCMPIIVVQMTTNMSYSLLDIAAMSYLGLGVVPPQSDWGSMLSEGSAYIMMAPNACIAAGVAIVLVVVCFNLFGDGLQDFFDPSLRKE